MYIDIGEKYYNKYYCPKRRTKIYDIPAICQVLYKHYFICSSQLTYVLLSVEEEPDVQ